MAAKLTWKGCFLIHNTMCIGEVRTRCADVEYDYVTDVGPRRVSEPYQSADDAAQDCESEVRRLLKEAGVDCE